MNICILSTDQVQDDVRLLEVAQAEGHNATLYNIRDISMALTPNQPTIYYQDKEITDRFDAVIPRLNVNFTDYGTNVLQQFMCTDTYVSESPEALRLGRDKLKSLQYLLARGLPFPTTGIAYSPQGFRPLAEHIGSPMVIKLIESTEGTGVFLVNTLKEMDNLVKTFNMLGASYVIQQFVREAAGSDVRAFVVGKRIVAAMCRQSQDGDFRANVSLGGHSHACQLSDEERNIVLSATESIGINVAGVDFVRSDKGPLLLEINVSPDFTGEQGIEKVTGVDVARAIIRHVIEEAKAFNSQHPTPDKVLESHGVRLCVDG